MNNIDIKFLLESDIENILRKHYSKPVLYKFLFRVVTDVQKYCDAEKDSKAKAAHGKVINILERLVAGEEVPREEIEAARNAASAAAYAASAAYAAAYAAANAAYAASAAAYYAHQAAYDAANAAYAAHQAAYDAANAANAVANAAYASRADANHANAAFGATIAVQKNYLIKLILEENNILSSTFDILFGEVV